MDTVVVLVTIGLICWAVAQLARRAEKDEAERNTVSGASVGSFYTKGRRGRGHTEGEGETGDGALGGFNNILDKGMSGMFLPTVKRVWDSLDPETKKRVGMVLGPEFALQMTQFTAMKGEAIGERQKMELETHLQLLNLRLTGNKTLTSIKAMTELSDVFSSTLDEVRAINDPMTRFLAWCGVSDQLAQYINATMPTLGKVTGGDMMKLVLLFENGKRLKPQVYRKLVEQVWSTWVSPGDNSYQELLDLYRTQEVGNEDEEDFNG